MSKPITWSHSALNAFITCPKQYYLTKVSKQVAFTPTEATTWGNSVHKALELRSCSKTPLPDTMTQWEPMMAKFDKLNATVEAETKYALTKNLTETTYFAPDVWLRSVLDLTIFNGRKVLTLDYKTGKPKPGSDQLKLAAAVLFAVKPEVEEVATGFVWLQTGKIEKETFTRSQVPEIWEEFNPKIRRLEIAFEENKWEAKPSGLCGKWCPVGKALCLHCGI